MWGNTKKPDTPPQAAQPELPKNIPMNQPPKTSAATWEGTTAMSTDAMRPMGATGDRATARLGPSLHVKGEISGNEDLLIEGSVEGLVQLDERKLTVGATAKLTADIIAREVVVYGTVKGNLRAKDRIEIKKDGSVNGDLTTARIMIEDGAYFKGSIEIDKSAEKESGAGSFARTAPRQRAQASVRKRFNGCCEKNCFFPSGVLSRAGRRFCFECHSSWYIQYFGKSKVYGYGGVVCPWVTLRPDRPRPRCKSSLAPASAAAAGGATVTIRGSGFQSATRARLGGQASFHDLQGYEHPQYCYTHALARSATVYSHQSRWRIRGSRCSLFRAIISPNHSVAWFILVCENSLRAGQCKHENLAIPI